MKKTPAILDKITDVVLAYRPKPKTKAAKRRKRREKVQASALFGVCRRSWCWGRAGCL